MPPHAQPRLLHQILAITGGAHPSGSIPQQLRAHLQIRLFQRAILGIHRRQPPSHHGTRLAEAGRAVLAPPHSTVGKARARNGQDATALQDQRTA
ncbi:hypothetical protein BVG79_p1000021 (plasmid) [Ketogulonicigenium robustum]|uniref:Uncharacterized protein n=1 Tax=Ketogulonicigenium robustum TaxID=92947 RepID=A0A1W6P332_9RHOB|nr:hypothetical protein BVG79_p1000021 [Ketogulonicigenium robustum]